MTDRTDNELLAAHLAGDTEAFGLLFRRHRDRLWAVALRTMGNPEDAADGLQDGLIAAYRRAASFRGDAALTTWLHRVVVNACLDRIRAAKVRHAQPLPDDVEEWGGPPVAAPEPTDPAQRLLDQERRRLVLAALNTLPAEQRASLVLVDMEGYSIQEAAAILDCAPGTVKSRCSRGRARLAVLLRDLIEQGRSPDNPGNHPADSDVPSAERPRGPPRRA